MMIQRRFLIRMQELGQIKSYHFNNKIILAIDSRWLDYFNSENPTFKAVIENGKYVLIGPKVTAQIKARLIVLSNSSDLISIVAIPRKHMKNLCSCLYCWCSNNTSSCNNCSKKYCKQHISNHTCFKNAEVWS